MADEYEEAKRNVIDDALLRARYRKARQEQGSDMSLGERALRDEPMRDEMFYQEIPLPGKELADLEEPFLRAGVPLSAAYNPGLRSFREFPSYDVGPNTVSVLDPSHISGKLFPPDSKIGTLYQFGETEETGPYRIMTPSTKGSAEVNRDFVVSMPEQAAATARDVGLDIAERRMSAKRSNLSPEAQERFDDLLLAKSLARLRESGHPIPLNVSSLDALQAELANSTVAAYDTVDAVRDETLKVD